MIAQTAPSPARTGPRPWFVVANASRASTWLRRTDNPGYDLHRTWDAPDARRTNAELGEDRPGRAFSAANATQRSGIDPEDADATPKGQAQRDFLKELAADLVAAFRAGEIPALYVAAPAPVLHRLREHVPHDLAGLIRGEEAADITQLPTAAMFERLDALRRVV